MNDFYMKFDLIRFEFDLIFSILVTFRICYLLLFIINVVISFGKISLRMLLNFALYCLHLADFFFWVFSSFTQFTGQYTIDDKI